MLEMLLLAVALVGPPGPETQGRASKAPAPRKRVAVWAGPLLGSILADQVTTERGLKLNGRVGRDGRVLEMHELNPMPGMGTLGGRVAWQSAELGAVVLALRSDKAQVRKLGKIGCVTAVAAHSVAAWLNEKHRGQALKALGK